MKRVMLACALFGVIAMANAQPPHEMDTPKATELQKILQLDDAQTTKVKNILDNSQQQRKALREKYKPQFEAYRSDMKKLHEQTHSQIAAVLTPKQAQALEALHEAHENRMEHMHGDDEDHDHPMPMK